METKRTRFYHKVKRTPGLLCYMPLNEVSGGRVFDHGPSRYSNGVYSGGTGNGYPTKLGKSYNLDGSTTTVSFNDSGAIPTLRMDLYNSFTVMFFLNIDAFNNNVLPRIWEKGSLYNAFMGDSNNARYKKIAMEFTDNLAGSPEWWSNDNKFVENTDYLFISNYNKTRSHLTGSNSRCIHYVNGVKQNTAAINSSAGGTDINPATTIALHLGRSRTNFTRCLDGRMSHFAMFTPELSEAQIKDLNHVAGLI